LVGAMSGERGIVIVGGGPAAKAAAGAYREAGGDGPVTIVAAEHDLPYERPPLTKGYLSGESSRGDLALEASDWYPDHGIEVVLGAAVAELDLDEGEARTEDGRHWPFERCLLATGARPLVPDLPGADGPDVRLVRTISDSEQLAALSGCQVLVAGSGFIGCEAAASLARRGARVTMATLESSPQLERLGAQVSERLAAWLGELGVALLTEADLAEISAPSAGALARFEDGREQEADAVVLALGIVRNDGLAAAAGVESDDGVVVDAAMVSSHPRLLAAGDVAFARNAAAGRRLRVEHWGEALNQGEVAGRTLAGTEASWDVAPGFWSTIGGRTLKYAGWGDGWDEVRFEATGGDGFAAWYGREGELVGVLAHQRDRAYEEGKRLVGERSPWS
jgi:3-phenylpropionate/trans-cinnamate dioxygenase ferredoxin reductase component